MSKIFELYGYRLDSWNKEAADNRANAWCSFMDAECDGGGNRYLSALDLRRNSKLRSYFPGKDTVQSGVCSLRIRDGEQPWIVCPRRLFSLRSQTQSKYQKHVRSQIAKYAELKPGSSYGAWSEVKMKVETTSNEYQCTAWRTRCSEHRWRVRMWV